MLIPSYELSPHRRYYPLGRRICWEYFSRFPLIFFFFFVCVWPVLCLLDAEFSRVYVDSTCPFGEFVDRFSHLKVPSPVTFRGAFSSIWLKSLADFKCFHSVISAPGGTWVRGPCL